MILNQAVHASVAENRQYETDTPRGAGYISEADVKGKRGDVGAEDCSKRNGIYNRDINWK